jgi:sec-independent protein translocase protein TatB
MGEITIILLLALIFLGPKKLPELASGLGKLIREIRKTTSDVKNEIQLDEVIRKPMEELREAMTLHPEELKRRDRLRKELEDLARRAEEVQEHINDPDPQDVAEAAAAEATAGADAATGSPADATVPEGVHVPASPDATAAGQGADAAKTPLPVPAIPGAAPTGTVSREPSGVTPPAPPLAAVLARGSGPHPTTERRTGAAGTDFLRSLRAVPDRRMTPAKPLPPLDGANSAADRSNTTQTMTEADLAALTVGGPPPPPGQTGKTQPPPPPPARLPGATPPKSPTD